MFLYQPLASALGISMGTQLLLQLRHLQLKDSHCSWRCICLGGLPRAAPRRYPPLHPGPVVHCPVFLPHQPQPEQGAFAGPTRGAPDERGTLPADAVPQQLRVDAELLWGTDAMQRRSRAPTLCSGESRSNGNTRPRRESATCSSRESSALQWPPPQVLKDAMRHCHTDLLHRA